MIILPMLEIKGLGRLDSTLPLSLWCVAWINSVVSDSRCAKFPFFDVSQLSFVFDGFVFEFAEWTIFRVRIDRNFVFFCFLLRCEFGLVGRPFYSILRGCVWNDLLVPDPFFGQVLFEGSGGVFASVVGS